MSDSVSDVTPESGQTQYEALVHRYHAAILACEDDATNAHLLKTASIETEEVESILEENDPTTENRYLDEQRVATVRDRVDEVQAARNGCLWLPEARLAIAA